MLGRKKVDCSRLTMMETLLLWRKARKDVRKKRFQPNEIPMTGQGEEPRHIATTPFVLSELKGFVATQRDYLGTRLHKFWVLDELGNKCDREATFPKMLRDLDEVARVLTTDINISIRHTQDQLDELHRRRQGHAGRREEHLVQMCINQADAVRERYYSTNISKYQGLNKILNEKVSIIEGAQKYLESRLGKVMLRLNYYYRVASERNPALEHMAFSEEAMHQMVDLAIMPEYDAVLTNTLQQIEAIDKDLEVLDI